MSAQLYLNMLLRLWTLRNKSNKAFFSWLNINNIKKSKIAGMILHFLLSISVTRDTHAAIVCGACVLLK